MTPQVVSEVRFVLAMAAPLDGGVSPLVQLIPFALILGIFYLVILLPMRRRQKKVDEFLAGLKVGDRVVTSGGLYGLDHEAWRQIHSAPDRRQSPRGRLAIGRHRPAGAGPRGAGGHRFLGALGARRLHDQESPLEAVGNRRRRGSSGPGQCTPSTRPSVSASTSRAASTSCSASRPTMHSVSRASRQWSGSAARSPRPARRA